jgi:hypothetical protein
MGGISYLFCEHTLCEHEVKIDLQLTLESKDLTTTIILNQIRIHDEGSECIDE